MFPTQEKLKALKKLRLIKQRADEASQKRESRMNDAFTRR